MSKNEPFAPWQCPLCGEKLTGDSTLKCTKGHCFDRAKEGYWHLLPVQSMRTKAPGDSKEMVAARRAFLNAGYYGIFGRALGELCLEYGLPAAPDAPLHLTDAFGGPKLAQALQEYKQLYSEYTAAVKHLSSLEQENEQQDLLLDRYAWEIKEISDAALKPGEENGLEAEARLLQNSERIMKAVDSSYQQLDEEDAILSRLARVRDQLQYAARYDSRLALLAECADSAWISLDDCRTELSEYMAGNEFNGERAAQVQQRLDIIYRLQKKYGGSTQSALEYLQQTQEKLEQLQQIAKLLEQAQKAVAEAVVRLGRAAAVLTQLREASAQALAQRITRLSFAPVLVMIIST